MKDEKLYTGVFGKYQVFEVGHDACKAKLLEEYIKDIKRELTDKEMCLFEEKAKITEMDFYLPK